MANFALELNEINQIGKEISFTERNGEFLFHFMNLLRSQKKTIHTIEHAIKELKNQYPFVEDLIYCLNSGNSLCKTFFQFFLLPEIESFPVAQEEFQSRVLNLLRSQNKKSKNFVEYKQKLSLIKNQSSPSFSKESELALNLSVSPPENRSLLSSYHDALKVFFGQYNVQLPCLPFLEKFRLETTFIWIKSKEDNQSLTLKIVYCHKCSRFGENSDELEYEVDLGFNKPRFLILESDIWRIATGTESVIASMLRVIESKPQHQETLKYLLKTAHLESERQINEFEY